MLSEGEQVREGRHGVTQNSGANLNIQEKRMLGLCNPLVWKMKCGNEIINNKKCLLVT